jgi:DNA-binding GntR family transcriptional regulator
MLALMPISSRRAARAPVHLTKTQVALETLRESIRSGDMMPGERLRVDDLTAALDMSPTPIREALRLLQADGLIEFKPHHEIVIAPVSSVRTAEIYQLRARLEPYAVELAVPRMGEEQLAQLQTVHERVSKAVRSGRGSTVSESNGEWHWTIYEQCGSQYLIDFLQRLWDAFPWRTIWAISGRSEQSLADHDAIMEAISRHDAKLAAKRMRQHVLSGVDTLISRLETTERGELAGAVAERSATR